MKTLILLRHAKSSWKDSSLADFDRPLKKRGRRDAQLIGELLRERKIKPDMVVSSPAERAKETTELVLESSGIRPDPKFDERVYEASSRRLLSLVTRFEDSANTVLLIGHNPGFEELLKSLTGENQKMPTAALACIDLNVDQWSSVRAKSGKVKLFVVPKELKDNLAQDD